MQNAKIVLIYCTQGWRWLLPARAIPKLYDFVNLILDPKPLMGTRIPLFSILFLIHVAYMCPYFSQENQNQLPI